jgi:demethylmenaquinone methyltransferase / 2-methoxy-6-polyprenyl-1,4-benzoquinol methylase
MPSDTPPLQDSRLELVDRLFTGTGRTYDSMVHWATFGIDRLWKRRMLELIPEGDGPVLDLACGTGISTLSIARRFPHRQVIGVELRDEYLQFAREKVRREAVGNVELVLCRAEDFHTTTRFDCISSSYLAKYADLPLLTRNCRDMLQPGGVLMMHDFTYPPKPALVALFRLYFLVMKQTVARAFPAWQEVYDGLPRLIEQTRWLEVLEDSLKREAFTGVRREYLTVYGSAIVHAVKASD